jgi:small GTP-binding protein
MCDISDDPIAFSEQPLGVMGCCGSKQEYRVLMLGVGAAGKTTILYRLKKNEVVHTIATVGFTMEVVHFGELEFCVWDLGGQDKIRPLWRHYFESAQGVIFVVDASDRSQFSTAKQGSIK